MTSAEVSFLAETSSTDVLVRPRRDEAADRSPGILGRIRLRIIAQMAVLGWLRHRVS